MNLDLQYLKLLSLAHYILGGIAAAFSSAAIVRFFLRFSKVVGHMGPPWHGHIGAAPGMHSILYGIGGLAFAVCLILSGRYLSKQIHYVFCLVIAAIACIFIPVGTVLGVLTLIVLTRPAVQELFERHRGEAH